VWVTVPRVLLAGCAIATAVGGEVLTGLCLALVLPIWIAASPDPRGERELP
jgi:hypothetical protein